MCKGRQQTLSSEKFARKNFVLGVLNGVLFSFAVSFTDPNTVLPYFVSLLTSSKFLIGFTTTISNFFYLLPQIFVANLTQHWSRRKPFYIIGALLRASSWFFLFLITYLWGSDNLSLLLFSFLALYSLSCLGGGLGGLPFLDIVGKIIVPTRRGKFFSLRLFFGGLLSIGGGLVVKYILGRPDLFPFPYNFSLLFFLTFIWISLAVSLFMCIREPDMPTKLNRRSSFFTYLRNIPRLLRKDHNYRMFFWAKILLSCGIITLPFYVIYARDVLSIPQEIVGVFVSAQMIGAAISAFFWGFLSDKYGNKIVVQLSGFIGMLVPILALAVGRLYSLSGYSDSLANDPGTFLIVAYTAVFMLLGMGINGNFIGQTNLLLEIAPSEQRSTYIGIINTATAFVTLLPLLGGYLIQWTSYEAAFLLSFSFMLAGLLFTLNIVEPRSNNKVRAH